MGLYLLLLVVHGIFEASANPPHILFIVADDLGWNDVGWHNPAMQTPSLDVLARGGVILDASYVQPVCTPSRSSFMTGYYPFHTGLQHDVIHPLNPGYLSTNFTILPQSLKDLGYVTHMVGKWHLGHCNLKYTPSFRGFDSFYGFLMGEEDYFSHRYGNGYDFWWNTKVYRPSKNKYSANLFADRAVQIIDEVDPRTERLFLYVAFQSVHWPLQVPQRLKTFIRISQTRTDGHTAAWCRHLMKQLGISQPL